MGNIDGRCDKKAVMKYAGAFIAWVIGSGFATGQEILQFFTSYGYYSYGVVILNLVGFLFLGNMLMTTGYAHKRTADLTILPIIAEKGREPFIHGWSWEPYCC